MKNKENRSNKGDIDKEIQRVGKLFWVLVKRESQKENDTHMIKQTQSKRYVKRERDRERLRKEEREKIGETLGD